MGGSSSIINHCVSQCSISSDQTAGQQRGPNEANVILLQYQLHKLFVLSIYYSVRGISMDSTKTSHEATEVLAAARGALQIQRRGMAVWSNWDLVVCRALNS
jgi:hypothetical protein